MLRPSAFNRLPIWAFPLAAVVFVASWQWATVSANYGGNWTALFSTGALRQQPPIALSEHVYVFPNSNGFDGQFYHYIAHDPFLRSDLKNYIDDARLRYRRILIPLLAYALALGQSDFIDRSYEAICLLSIGLGTYWSCRLAQNSGLTAAWGLLFLALPAIPITLDRLVVDAGLAALAAAFLYYSPKPSWKLFVVLACAAMTRETGFLLLLAYCSFLAWRREFQASATFLLAAIPAAAWYAYAQVKTMGSPYPVSFIPFSAILRVLRHPSRYPPGTPFADAIRAADYLALAGVLMAFGLAFFCFARGPWDPPRIAAMLFATLAIVLQRTDHWQNVYDFGRVYTPALLCIAAIAAQYRNPWLLAPIVMMLPRIAIQLASQMLSVARWIG
jgi:hypothetical protein